ncbi:MAG: DUF4469 domain-containing protein [Treponema sp.]|nr:DUF4469 domain-containing protein [Treponema sp.]
MTNIDTKRETNFAVTLTPCRFKENTYIAHVPRRTVSTDQILDLVSAHNQGIDRYQVGHAMALLKKEILEQAELGFSVDILEICKLYIAPISSVQSLTPESESVTGFEARFSVNERLRERLKGMTATVTAVTDSSPQISQIENPMTKMETDNGLLKATFSARILGKKLKVAGDLGGIFFVPLLDDGNPSKNEDDWIKVPDSFITRNTDKTLEFHLPRNITANTRYYIAVRASERNGTELKNPVTGISKIPVLIQE